MGERMRRRRGPYISYLPFLSSYIYILKKKKKKVHKITDQEREGEPGKSNSGNW